jgi:hypothetical protein
MKLHGLVDDALRTFGRIHLGHRGLRRHPLAAGISKVRRTRHKKSRSVQFGGHFGDVRLHHLLLGQWRSELTATIDMFDRRLQRAPRHSVRRGADRDPERIERFHRNAKTRSHVPNHVAFRNAAPGKTHAPDGMRNVHGERFE